MNQKRYIKGYIKNMVRHATKDNHNDDDDHI